VKIPFPSDENLYRVKLIQSRTSLSIWMEDQLTKDQWERVRSKFHEISEVCYN